MRAPAALAVLMTSALVHYSNAQASGYGASGNNGGGNGGNTGGAGSGSQGGNSNGIPDNGAYGNPAGIANANPAKNPGGNSGGIPGGVPAGLPGASTCASQTALTTVFVTVVPTDSLNPAGLSQPGGSDTDQTVHQTLHPTTTILVSPVQSLQATQSSVEPFTTITIDVWGTSFNSRNSSPVVTDDHQPPVYSNAISSLASPSAANSNAGLASTQVPWSTPQPTANAGASIGPDSGPAATVVPYGDIKGLPNGSGFPVQASATASSPFAVVTDTNVHWIPGSQGLTQVTVLSAHTLTLGPDTMASPPSDGSVPRLTFTGPDGKPTVVEYPSGLPLNGGSSALAITTGVAIPTAGVTVFGPAASPSAGSTTCTSYTIIGSDGLPTVVQSTWTVGLLTAAPSGLPSGVPSLPSANQGFPNGLGSTACTSYTILGPDGRPTIIESTWLVPTPLNTQSALAVTSGLSLPTLSGAPSLSQITPGPVLPSGLGPVIPGGPGGPGIVTCTTYTIIGPDGRPSVVDSTWTIPFASATNPAASPNAITGIPGQASGFPSLLPLPSGIQASVNGITTCATYTVLGLNGLPTVVESTWAVPLPTATAGNAISGIPNPVTGFPGAPSQVVGSAAGVNGVTTCTTYTALGINGLPTVVESTFVVPVSNALPAATSLGFPSAVPQANTIPAQVPLPSSLGSGAAPTTCTTVGVVGPDGRTTPVVQTVVLTPGIGNGLPSPSALGSPPLVPQQDQTALPQGIPTAISANQPATTCLTIDVLGPNGIVTPVVQTVVLSTNSPGIGINPSTPVPLSGVPPLPQSLPGGLPTLSGYANSASGLHSVLPPSADVSGIIANPGGLPTGTFASLFTVVNGPGGQSLLPLPSYNDPSGSGSPFPGSAQAPQNGLGSLTSQAAGLPTSAQYGPLPAAANGAHIATVLQTSTWTNIIPEQTTTYTLNFPLTTMATVTVPVNKRALRRQQSSLSSSSGWGNSSSITSNTFSENTSLGASLSSALGSQSANPPLLPPVPTTAPALPSATAAASATPTMCANGGEIGNLTLDFDEIKPGPLFNPASDIWFSEGFIIVPPASQASQSYIPSSGGQLVEFVPPSLSSVSSPSGSRDTAEIGVGPNTASPCFKFDFHGANLGCAAQGNEQWCEFEISAYSYNEGSTKEQSIAWSETKRVPACPNFPSGNCQLTPVQLDGYTNITSVLIKLHVGLDLRVWWGDDFRIGWTDNSCTAAACRAGTLPHRVRRTTIESAAQKGVGHWTPSGLERLDDENIWESLNY